MPNRRGIKQSRLNYRDVEEPDQLTFLLYWIRYHISLIKEMSLLQTKPILELDFVKDIRTTLSTQGVHASGKKVTNLMKIVVPVSPLIEITETNPSFGRKR